MEYDVFVSYSHPDKAAADAACATLEQAGIRCWIAPRDIVPGTDWSESIINAIAGAKLMVLIFSQHANVSPQIKREVERAVNKGLPIIPVRIEDAVPSVIHADIDHHIAPLPAAAGAPVRHTLHDVGHRNRR
jgi:TIR domain-containing protein